MECGAGAFAREARFVRVPHPDAALFAAPGWAPQYLYRPLLAM